jgi:predicted DNA-binding protein (UPF0251 family)
MKRKSKAPRQKTRITCLAEFRLAKPKETEAQIIKRIYLRMKQLERWMRYDPIRYAKAVQNLGINFIDSTSEMNTKTF